MNRRPTPQAIARRFLHDRLCVSGCEGDQADDHAKRTQADFARDVMRARAANAGLEGVIHQHACLGCARPLLHRTALLPVAQELEALLVGNAPGPS